jgi:para-nitrobenzyl esterase
MKARFRRLRFAAALLAVTAFANFKQPVRTETGLVEGVSIGDSGVAAFKGIPYAAPPVGQLRWRAPQPGAEWTGVRRADHFSPGCTQRRTGPIGPWSAEFISKAGMEGGSSEDCLYLNVWTAAKSAGERRPVFVWIYGGGFASGSGDVPVYDGEALAAKGVVVVNFNYRLGALGFLAHPELTNESGHNASGNYAILDAIAALQWVRKNIRAFGGDPGNVTIAGQSAGAFMVNYLVISPLAKGLFHRAIAESGGSFLKTADLSEAEERGLKLAHSLNAANIAELRSRPAEALLASGPGMQFGPIVDGWVVPKDAHSVFAAGQQNDVPVLTGWNAGDGVALGPPLTAEKFREQAASQYGDLAIQFLKVFPAESDQAAAASQKAASRDQIFAWQGRTWARMQSKTGKSKVFLYYFDRVPPGTPEQNRYGAFHSAEIAYALDTLSKWARPWEAADRNLANIMSTYWVNFARTGDPNGGGLPMWPAYSRSDGRSMRLGDTFGPIPVPDKAELDFFDLYYPRSRAR